MEAIEYKTQVLDSGEDHVLIDVRPKVEQDIVKLPHSVTIPLAEMKAGTESLMFVQEMLKKKKKVYVHCRKGNASQIAVRFLKDNLPDIEGRDDIRDVIGGIEAWKQQVDPSIPSY
jgi:adenylyltransferase/sulfurtransferase